MTDDRSSAAPGYSRRAIGFALACLLLGPPIGACLIMLCFPIADFVVTGGASLARFEPAELSGHLASMVIAAVLSYLFGGLPALASAIWVGMRTYKFGRFGYIEASLVSLVSTLALVPFKPPASTDLATWTLGSLVLPASVVSALIVRRILGRWMR